MTYNLTDLQNSQGVYDVIVYANDSTTGILGMLLMIAIFIVMLMALKRYQFPRALLASSFVCFILSSILVYIKWLNFMFPLGFLACTAFTALYLFTNKDA